MTNNKLELMFLASLIAFHRGVSSEAAYGSEIVNPLLDSSISAVAAYIESESVDLFAIWTDELIVMTGIVESYASGPLSEVLPIFCAKAVPFMPVDVVRKGLLQSAARMRRGFPPLIPTQGGIC